MCITKQAEKEIYLIAEKKIRWCSPPPFGHQQLAAACYCRAFCVAGWQHEGGVAPLMAPESSTNRSFHIIPCFSSTCFFRLSAAIIRAGVATHYSEDGSHSLSSFRPDNILLICIISLHHTHTQTHPHTHLPILELKMRRIFRQ